MPASSEPSRTSNGWFSNPAQFGGWLKHWQTGSVSYSWYLLT